MIFYCYCNESSKIIQVTGKWHVNYLRTTCLLCLLIRKIVLYLMLYLTCCCSWRQFVFVALDTGLKWLSLFLKVVKFVAAIYLLYVNLHNSDNLSCSPTDKPWWSFGDRNDPFNSSVLHVKRKVGACSYVDDPIGCQSLLSRAMHKVLLTDFTTNQPFRKYSSVLT